MDNIWTVFHYFKQKNKTQSVTDSFATRIYDGFSLIILIIATLVALFSDLGKFGM